MQIQVNNLTQLQNDLNRERASRQIAESQRDLLKVEVDNLKIKLEPITDKKGSWLDFYSWLKREITDLNEKGEGKWNKLLFLYYIY